MKLAKRLGQSPKIRAGLCWLASIYIRLVHSTGRWRINGDGLPNTLWDTQKPFILCFWHGRLLMMPKIWRHGVPIHMLISQHRDGELIARTVAHFGIRWLAGSSTRGGGAALRTMLKALKAGDCVGITPDGPHGPRARVSPGIISVAKLSGCAIIPATWSADRAWTIRSWDRFMVAKPFANGVFLWGEPLEIPRDADEHAQERLRLELETRMNALSSQADASVGRPYDPPDALERVA